MADLQEIDMTKATDMNNKKVRLVGDDGKGYWMEKEDLAKVVGGLIGTATDSKNGLLPKTNNIISKIADNKCLKISVKSSIGGSCNISLMGSFLFGAYQTFLYISAGISSVGSGASMVTTRSNIGCLYKVSEDDKTVIEIYIKSCYSVNLMMFTDNVQSKTVTVIENIEVPEDAIAISNAFQLKS